jgi:hypothetical protein
VNLATFSNNLLAEKKKGTIVLFRYEQTGPFSHCTSFGREIESINTSIRVLQADVNEGWCIVTTWHVQHEATAVLDSGLTSLMIEGRPVAAPDPADWPHSAEVNNCVTPYTHPPPLSRISKRVRYSLTWHKHNSPSHRLDCSTVLSLDKLL